MKILICCSIAVFTIIFLTCLLGCSANSSIVKSISQASAYPRVIERADKSKRYFIMYSGVDTYRVTSAEVEKTKQQFTVRLAKPDAQHILSLRSPATITDQLIQMYMRDSASYTLDEPHTIPMAKVARIELVH